MPARELAFGDQPMAAGHGTVVMSQQHVHRCILCCGGASEEKNPGLEIVARYIALRIEKATRSDGSACVFPPVVQLVKLIVMRTFSPNCLGPLGVSRQ